jgi:hypothetical protein
VAICYAVAASMRFIGISTRRGLIRIPRARELDPLADLAKNERAQKEILLGDRSIPGRNMSVRSARPCAAL